MTLEQLKLAYLNKELSLLKISRRADMYNEELGKLYPEDIPLAGKMYLYLNDLPVDTGYCPVAKKARAFSGLNAGFRQYCGNQNSCICNKEASHTRWKEMSRETKEDINAARKKTVMAKYGVESVSQLESSKAKAEKTCMAKYGTKSPTQNPTVLKKSSDTCFKNHGTSWPQQNADIYAKTTDSFMARYGVTRPSQHCIFHEKMKSTMIDRHGVTNPMQLSVVRNAISAAWKKEVYADLCVSRTKLTSVFTLEEYQQSSHDTLLLWKCNDCGTEFYETIAGTYKNKCVVCDPKHMSWGEVVISRWLTDAGIDFEFGSFAIISPLQLDFYIPSLNLAIEFNGTYWHSELAGRSRNYHFDKFKKCTDKGIKLIQVFEHELMFKEEIIKARILNAIGAVQNKKFARKLSVEKITTLLARQFFTENHLQGYVPSKHNYALIENNEAISVMSFTKSRYSKNSAEWELTRFATKKNVSVVGGASKLFAAFVADVCPSSVVSYADLNWGTGNVYTNMGFEFKHYSKPNYWYFKSLDDIKSRIKFQKHKLPLDLHHLGSEWDIMRATGWNRFWDCGNSVWIWKAPH